MLTEALQTVRELVDEAIQTDDPRAAARLSRLASTLERAERSQRQESMEAMPLNHAHELLRNLVEEFCAVARERMTEDDFALFELAIKGALPPPVPVDPNLEQLNKECNQALSLFTDAVAAKMTPDVVRLGGLLIVKQKALARAENDAGRHVTLEMFREIFAPVIAAAVNARALIGDENYDPVLDQFLEATYGP